MKRIAILLSVTAFLFSCGNQETPDFDTFEYRFHDSSVPPEYHRSYTIRMTTDSISKWVDSYGDTVSYEIKPVKKSDLNKLKDLVKKAALYNCERKVEPGCTGGTGFSIYYYQDNQQIFKGSKYQCGGQDEGDLRGETDEILTFLSRYFSNKTE